jgi:membrane-associated protease RseP (regulator of RpoE activity)
MGIRHWPRALLFALAILYTGLVGLYSAMWMYGARRGVSAWSGIESEHDPAASSRRVITVFPDTPAARSGLRAGDRIVAINGRGLGTPEPFNDAVLRGRPATAWRCRSCAARARRP